MSLLVWVWYYLIPHFESSPLFLMGKDSSGQEYVIWIESPDAVREDLHQYIRQLRYLVVAGMPFFVQTTYPFR